VAGAMMRRMPGHRSTVDTPDGRSVSFATHLTQRPSASPDAWRPVAVGPGRSVAGPLLQGALGEGMNGYPVQPAKVQVPALRDQTLARDRLLDWLAAKIHQRVVLVIADAGYGKTTLLADFSGRTRSRMLWYRLDDDDRDWIAFLSHLIAAGREHDPSFAPTTWAMLSDLSVGGPTREAATTVFLRELPRIAEHGAVLILDDFHLVDESPDIRAIARELVARAPERLSIVFASRRPPSIPLARLRATGEVAELGTDDLRFDLEETSRLFSETYGRTLEADVLVDVAARTEGWAASLQLVQAALRDRSPSEIRRFVRGMSGADQELYDYLAEEVVGDLPEDLQLFLMRTSILQVVTPDLAAVVTGLDEAEVARLTANAERLTLLARPSRASRGRQRYHPLVREFLEARLRATVGDKAVATLHRQAAESVATTDWSLAAYHYRHAGDSAAVAAVIESAMPEIMGKGQHSIAIEHMAPIPPGEWPAGLGLMRSRIEMQQGDYASAIASSSAVRDAVAVGTRESDYALLNLATMFWQSGESDRSRFLAEQLRDSTSSEDLKLIAEATIAMIDAESTGSVEEVDRHLSYMAERQRGIQPHFFGVTMLNRSTNAILADDPHSALAYAQEAVDALQETSSMIELSTALMARAASLTLLGHTQEAAFAIDEARGLGQTEAVMEHAELADSFLSPETAWGLLESVEGRPGTTRVEVSGWANQTARYLARRGRHSEATARLADVDARWLGGLPGQLAERLTTAAYVASAAGDPEAEALAERALTAAKRQSASRWMRVAHLIRASALGGNDLSDALRAIGDRSPWTVTYVADLVLPRIDELDEAGFNIVRRASTNHPARWRHDLRGHIRTGSSASLRAVRLLEDIGEKQDVPLLRDFARRHRRLPGSGQVGRHLARRLADPVYVEDQNRVAIRIADRMIGGSTVRRKVLALLCFLLTRPDMSSTRDQVLEALWPELDPMDAVNSLNQTVYFLRRIVEENYVEDLSPGYLHHYSDLIWLDQELVDSRSNTCRRLIKALPPVPSSDQVAELAIQYEGRFALDFEYEDWAAPYRDWLHASFLEVVERAVMSDLESGHYHRGITLARRVIDIDPTADRVEVSLLRLYRASGAHSAAAEQYSHYVSALRDQLGIEAPPLESL
jgi:DNA-binding SARP family transcriptional activator